MPATVLFTLYLMVIVPGYGDAEVPKLSPCWFESDPSLLQSISLLYPEAVRTNIKVSRLELCGNATCPDGWVLAGANCYLFDPDKMSFTDAKENCIYKGGRLAEPKSLMTNDLLKSKIPPNMAQTWWIGLMGEGPHALWIASDYDDWKPGYPKPDRHADCIALEHDGWVNKPCDDMYGAILELI